MTEYAAFPLQAAMDVAEHPAMPVTSALAAAQQGAGAVQQFMQRRADLQTAQQMHQLGAQQIQSGAMQLQAEPQMIENQLRSQAHSLAAQRLQQDKNIHGYVLSRLAELKGTPPDQLAANWGTFRQHLIDVGANPNEIPQQYNSNVQNAIDQAHAIVTTPFEQKKELEEVKGRTAVETAMARQQIKTGAEPPTEKKAFDQAEGKKNSDYFDTIATDADNSSKIYNDTLQMGGLGKQVSSQFGVVRGNSMMLTPKGQQLMQSVSQFVLDKFDDIHHVGQAGRLLINQIQKSKAQSTISYDAFKNIVAAFRAVSSRGMEKNKFAAYLKQNGITDRNRIQNIWNMYQQVYPIYDELGHANTKNVGQWEKFLADNPQYMSTAMAHHQTAKVPMHAGLHFIIGGEPTLYTSGSQLW